VPQCTRSGSDKPLLALAVHRPCDSIHSGFTTLPLRLITSRLARSSRAPTQMRSAGGTGRFRRAPYQLRAAPASTDTSADAYGTAPLGDRNTPTVIAPGPGSAASGSSIAVTGSVPGTATSTVTQLWPIVEKIMFQGAFSFSARHTFWAAAGPAPTSAARQARHAREPRRARRSSMGGSRGGREERAV
jgi:hypothetical protein